MKKRSLLRVSCVFVLMLLLVTGCSEKNDDTNKVEKNSNVESNVNLKATSFKEIMEGYAKEKNLKVDKDVYDGDSLKKMNCTYAVNYSTDDYKMDVLEFSNQESLKKTYDEKISTLKQLSTKVDMLEENDNVFEAIIMVEPSGNTPAVEEVSYEYSLLIKSEKEMIVVFEDSSSADKENMKKIGKEIKDLIQAQASK